MKQFSKVIKEEEKPENHMMVGHSRVSIMHVRFIETNFIHTGRKSYTDLRSFLTEFERYCIFDVLCRLNLNLSMNSNEFEV